MKNLFITFIILTGISCFGQEVSLEFSTTPNAQTLSVVGQNLTISGGNTITVPETGDASTTNELQTIANTSNSTTHTVTLSNSGGSMQLVEGANITLTTTGTSDAGVITIASTGVADNLGNHILTQNIAGGQFNILNVNKIVEDTTITSTIFAPASSTLQLGANNAVGIHLTTSNVVGINTTTPNAAFKLDVNGPSMARGFIRSSGAGSIGSLSAAQFQTLNTTTSGAWQIHHEDDDDLVFNFSGPGNDALKLDGFVSSTLFNTVGSQTITSTSATAITRSRVFYNVAAGGTVNADLSAAPEGSEIVFFNIDNDAITLNLTGATWATGSSPNLTQFQSVTAHLRSGVLYQY